MGPSVPHCHGKSAATAANGHVLSVLEEGVVVMVWLVGSFGLLGVSPPEGTGAGVIGGKTGTGGTAPTMPQIRPPTPIMKGIGTPSLVVVVVMASVTEAYCG